MNKTFGIMDLLRLNRQFDVNRPMKIARHQDGSYDMQELVRSNWFEAYQRYQRRPVFDRSEFIVSCLGGEGSTARFHGVYKVHGRRGANVVPLPEGCLHPTIRHVPGFWYDLRREPGFEALENRVVIEWGKGTRSWCQRLVNKEVVEILPKGQVRPPFKDYVEFNLTHDELCDLCRNAEANREWRARLAAVAGVYLIVATTNGAQYVGSAYGELGIWGRWTHYANSGHGGNSLLRDLLRHDPAYPRAFQYSILQILPKTMAKAEVLLREGHYKRKLGKRATSLNAN